jgi:hypothetical protein
MAAVAPVPYRSRLERQRELFDANLGGLSLTKDERQVRAPT